VIALLGDSGNFQRGLVEEVGRWGLVLGGCILSQAPPCLSMPLVHHE
jgi:hypothetical protein